MADYSKFVALAQKLITKRGRLVSLQQLSGGASDPTKPWKGAGAPAVAVQVDNVPAVFLDAKGLDIKSVIKDDNLLKRATDVALIAPGAVDFSIMNMILDGKPMRIEWCHVLKPGDTVCLYVFGMMR
jgi:hypothetical protein